MAHELPAGRVETVAVANPSPAHALQDLAESSGAAIVVVGSTHTGRAGRVVPGATGERLLHGAPCAVAVVPEGYAAHVPAIRRIAVAYDGSETAKAAVAAAAGAARALDADLEVIGVVNPEAVVAGGFGYLVAREDVEAQLQAELDGVVAGLPYGVRAEGVRLTGDPADALIERSEGTDLLVMGSRGYGPLRAVLVGGVSGRVVREAHCPVIVVPRGVEAPLGELFGAVATSLR
jgi:nucleotide-binding universal stress UspA family protein